MEQPTNQPQRKITVFGLILVFGLPIILAIYYFSKGQPVGSTTNHGELITPMKIAPLQLSNINGVALSEKEIEGKWTLAYLPSTECTDECSQKLYFMQQLHTAMGKRQDKVRTVALIFANQPSDPQLKEIIKHQYPTTEIWVSKANILINKTTNQKLQFGTKDMYIFDPQGNVMMHYKNNTDPNDILKDLEKLVKD